MAQKLKVFLSQIRLILAGLVLLVVVVLFHLAPNVRASLLVGQIPVDGTPAPSAPIQPASKSVIEFKELAARDAEGSGSRQPAATGFKSSREGAAATWGDSRTGDQDPGAGWEQLLESNKQAYALEFVQTSRFVTALPTTKTPAEFADQLNQ